MRINNNFSARYVQLELGCEYDIRFHYCQKESIHCRFIKTTRQGFNFLNLSKHKCIFPKHFYRKKDKHGNKIMVFLVSNNVFIDKHKPKKEC
jgi:exoribonuclease II